MKKHLLALALAVLMVGAPAAPAQATGGASPLYLALGDSVSRGYGAGTGHGFVDLYFEYLRDPGHGGLAEVANLAIPGETSASMLEAGGQLDDAIATIGEPSDTQLVTLDIGGNDGLAGDCPVGYNDPPCPFKENYAEILSRLRDALADDPGTETIQALEYYNPASGTGTPSEGMLDYALLGGDGRVDCSGSGQALGLNDHVRCIGRDYAVTAVDSYPAFKTGGQSLMADNVHPNETGHAYIACLFEHPPPAPGPAPGPDTRAPIVSLAGARSQRMLPGRGVSLVVETDEAASVTVSGSIAIPKRATVARFRPVTRSVAAHSPTRFRLQLTNKSLARVRRALRARRVLTARIRVRVRDSAGNSRLLARRVRLAYSEIRTLDRHRRSS
jgi:lysophospholipase L1-like esterase